MQLRMEYTKLQLQTYKTNVNYTFTKIMTCMNKYFAQKPLKNMMALVKLFGYPNEGNKDGNALITFKTKY